MTLHLRARSGFTLIELLIALVLTGVVGALVLDFVLAQGRFGARQAAVQEVQQNARGALELIVSELRAVPPGAIASTVSTAGTDELQFRLPLAWGVICGAAGTATPVVSFPLNTVPGSLPGGWGLDVPNGTAGARTAVAGTAVSALAAGGCDTGVTSAAADVRSVPLNAAIPDLPVGTAVFIYEPVRYSVATGPGASGANWLYRANPTVSTIGQPLAGPVEAFRVRFNPPSSSGASSAENVSTVEVKVSAQSQGKVQNGVALVDSASMVVFLRNRI